MNLTPREKDKLLIFTAALLAEKRLARGVEVESSRGDRVSDGGAFGRRS